jgi:hypothetical protein
MTDLPSPIAPNPAVPDDTTPGTVPQPSVWPPLLAFGATMVLWGLISSFIITGAGTICVLVAVTGWISAIRHERQEHP